VIAAFSHCGFCGTSRVASAPTLVFGGGNAPTPGGGGRGHGLQRWVPVTTAPTPTPMLPRVSPNRSGRP
jgi:hypothetical protein